MHTPYKVLLAYDDTELLAYPTDVVGFPVFAIFVGSAFLANFVLWAYSEKSYFGAIGYMVLFAIGTTLFTALAVGGCVKSGCHLANVIVLAQPWGWLFGAIAALFATICSVANLFR
jgi:hypothetical protein